MILLLIFLVHGQMQFANSGSAFIFSAADRERSAHFPDYREGSSHEERNCKCEKANRNSVLQNLPPRVTYTLAPKFFSNGADIRLPRPSASRASPYSFA
jgi:hypothetical protein